jgi:hypothetical protein
MTKRNFVEIFSSENITRVTQQRIPIPSTSKAVPDCVLMITIEKKGNKARRMNFHPGISVRNELKAKIIANANITPEKTGCPKVPFSLIPAWLANTSSGRTAITPEITAPLRNPRIANLTED